MQWEQRQRRTGLCSFTSYYVGRPSMRVVDEAYSETVFELQPDQIKARRRWPATAGCHSRVFRRLCFSSHGLR